MTNARPVPGERCREATCIGTGGTGRRTHMSRSGCWTWQPNRIGRISRDEREGGSSPGNGLPGRVDEQTALRAPEAGRKAPRPGTESIRARTVVRHRTDGLGRHAERNGTDRNEDVAACAEACPFADGYRNMSQRSWNWLRSPWKHRAPDGRQRRSSATDSSMEKGLEVELSIDAIPAAASLTGSVSREQRESRTTAGRQRPR